jgi:hypothetical protein
MNGSDDWGRDPAVRRLREVFGSMEMHQAELLRQLNISVYDPRLQQWRKQARWLFSRAWQQADRMGVTMDAEKAGRIFVAALSRVLALEGLPKPTALPTDDAEIARIFKEVDA